MKIRFLGTGASDWPVKLRGTEGYRRFSSALINDKVLIDPGPHILDFAEDFDCEDMFDVVDNILLTHSHDDHFYPQTAEKLCDKKVRNIWCEENATEVMKGIEGLKPQILEMYKEYNIDNLKVIAVPANHATAVANEQALHYIIEQDGKCIFYGCDGAWIRRDTWYFMKDMKFDMMILDGTLADDYGDYRIFEHNNLRMVELIAETVRNTGVIKPEGRIIISHLAYGVHGTQKEVEQRLKAANIEVAYDGHIIEL